MKRQQWLWAAVASATILYAGKITQQEASYLMELQRNAARTVLLTIEGLGIIAVQEVINAALAVMRDTVNSALGGWKIL